MALLAGALSRSVVVALLLGPGPSPAAPGTRWTRVKAPASASAAVLAAATARPVLPYPYFTTYVLRGPTGSRPDSRCRAEQGAARRVPRRSPE